MNVMFVFPIAAAAASVIDFLRCSSDFLRLPIFSLVIQVKKLRTNNINENFVDEAVFVLRRIGEQEEEIACNEKVRKTTSFI